MSIRSSNPGFVGRDTQLARIIERVDALNQVLDTVRRAVPPELAPFCLGVAWSGTTLLVALPHSAAAARLRMVAPSLLTALQIAGWHATSIRPQVQVALQREKPKPGNQLAMSQSALDAFSGLAQTVDNDELRSAILDLLKHQHQRRGLY